MLRENPDGSLSANPQQFNRVAWGVRDDAEIFPIERGKYQATSDKEQQCIQGHHDGEVSGHPSIVRTLENIQRRFSFPQTRQKVIAYITKCDYRGCSTQYASKVMYTYTRTFRDVSIVVGEWWVHFDNSPGDGMSSPWYCWLCSGMCESRHASQPEVF